MQIYHYCKLKQRHFCLFLNKDIPSKYKAISNLTAAFVVELVDSAVGEKVPRGSLISPALRADHFSSVGAMSRVK